MIPILDWQIAMFLFGIFLSVMGLVLFFMQRDEKQKAFSIRSARSITTAELIEMAGAVAAEIGGGSWRDYVKLWGEVVTEQPLYSESKQEPCVYYTSEVMREYEVNERIEQSDGTMKMERRRTSERISCHSHSISLLLRDRTGSVKVDPDGAAIETIEILNEFCPQQSGNTLGYHYQERVLPVGREILVVGAVSDLAGEVVISKPIQSAHKYLFSFKNEAALTVAAIREAKTLHYKMVGCLTLGILCIVVGLF